MQEGTLDVAVFATGGAALAYLMGAIPFGYLMVRVVKGTDVRRHGSGNIGATNVIRTAGTPAGLAVGALDVAKGWGGLALACAIQPEPDPWIRLGLGVAAIAGHNWPVWLRFRGGKGVLTSAGVLAYLAWLPLAGAVAAFAAIFLVTGYVSVGSILGAATFTVLVFTWAGPWQDTATRAIAVIVLLLIVVRHRSNLRDLARGTERRFRIFGSADRRTRPGRGGAA